MHPYRTWSVRPMLGSCSSAGWSPLPTVAGYNCSFHGVLLNRRVHRVASGPGTGRTRVLVSGCARKLGSLLGPGGAVPQMVDKVLGSVAHSGALLYADGATLDDSFAKLQSWSEQDPRVRSVLALEEPSGRLGRIALCRNTILGEAVNRLPGDGLLVTVDLDCQVSVPSIVALLPQLWSPHEASQWDMLTANSEPYRDLWALRSSRLGVDYDCWQDSKTMAFRGSCLRYRISVDSTAPIIPVRSAFNGASVLRMAAMHEHNATHCRYPAPERTALDHNDSSHRAVCEHAVLNGCLHERGVRIGIAPALQTNCPCGAFCGELQRYFYRVQVFANGTLMVRDHRKRRPFNPHQWARFVEPMCAQPPISTHHGMPSADSSSSAISNLHMPHGMKSVQDPSAAHEGTARDKGVHLVVVERRMMERVAPATAPTTVC